MTEQQRTARIEFVKKLLVANGFKEVLNTGYHSSILKYANNGFVCIVWEWITLFEANTAWSKHIILHTQPLTLLREFIKLSNQK